MLGSVKGTNQYTPTPVNIFAQSFIQSRQLAPEPLRLIKEFLRLHHRLGWNTTTSYLQVFYLFSSVASIPAIAMYIFPYPSRCHCSI